MALIVVLTRRAQLLSALDTVYLSDHLKKPLPVVPAPVSKGKKRASPKKAVPSGSGAGTGYGSGAGANPYAYGYASAALNGTGYAADDGMGMDSDLDSEYDLELWQDMQYDSGNYEYDGEDGEVNMDGYEEWKAERKKKREARKVRSSLPFYLSSL